MGNNLNYVLKILEEKIRFVQMDDKDENKIRELRKAKKILSDGCGYLHRWSGVDGEIKPVMYRDI